MNTKPEGYRKRGRKGKPKPKGKAAGGSVSFPAWIGSDHADVHRGQCLFLACSLGCNVHDNGSFNSFQMDKIEVLIEHIAGSFRLCFTTRARQCDRADCNVVRDFLWHGSIITQREC